jgi:hypothetical protein
MKLWLLLIVLAGAPKLGTPVAVQQKDGRWKCSAMCLTGGNADGGYCRSPVLSYDKPTRDACTADLEAQCATKMPPPGGCRWDANPPAGK